MTIVSILSFASILIGGNAVMLVSITDRNRSQFAFLVFHLGGGLILLVLFLIILLGNDHCHANPRPLRSRVNELFWWSILTGR